MDLESRRVMTGSDKEGGVCLAGLSIPDGELPGQKEDFEKLAEEMRADTEMRQGLANGCTWPLLFVYRDVSDEDLVRYSAFFGTPAGKWFEATDLAAKYAAIVQAAVRLGRLVDDEALRRPKESLP